VNIIEAALCVKLTDEDLEWHTSHYDGDELEAKHVRAMARELRAARKVVEAFRKGHPDCYCDCNSGSCPCSPCQKMRDKALAAYDEVTK
jgi:hypothetical protein